MDGRTTKKLITHLKPNTFYNFVLTNRGSSLGGLQQTVTAWTAFNLLSGKPSVAPKPNADGFILVYLPDGQSPVPVQYAVPRGPSPPLASPLTSLGLRSSARVKARSGGEVCRGGVYSGGSASPVGVAPRKVQGFSQEASLTVACVCSDTLCA